MRWLVTLLVACIALAALQYALAALVIALFILILWGAIVHPAETLGSMAFFLMANVFVNHTVACLTFAGFIGFLLIFARRSKHPTTNETAALTDCARITHNDST